MSITIEEDLGDAIGTIVAMGSHRGGPARMKLTVSDPAGEISREYAGDLIEVVNYESMSGKRRQIRILIEEQRKDEV